MNKYSSDCRAACVRLGGTLVALLVAPCAFAQQYLGDLAAACANTTVGGQVALPIAAPVVLGDTVIVAVASGSDAIGEIRIVDARNNLYRPFGAERADQRRFAAAHFVAAVTTALIASDVLTVRIGQAAPGQQVCLRASVFRGVIGTANALDTHGGREDSGTAFSVDARDGSYSGMLNFASFTWSGDAGTIGTAVATQLLPRICSVGNALCLTSAYNFSTAPGAQNVSANASNPVPWAGTLSSLYVIANLNLFKNSFE